MLFAELSHGKSPAERVILYPSEWNERKESQESMTTNLETSMRLLQRAAKRYSVQLLPITPILEGGVGKYIGDSILGKHIADPYRQKQV